MLLRLVGFVYNFDARVPDYRCIIVRSCGDKHSMLMKPTVVEIGEIDITAGEPCLS